MCFELQYITACELDTVNVELNIIVSENTKRHRDNGMDNDSDGYINPNPIPFEEDESGYMNVNKRIKLINNGIGYLKPISNLGASAVIEEANYTGIESQNENDYINCEFVDA